MFILSLLFKYLPRFERFESSIRRRRRGALALVLALTLAAGGCSMTRFGYDMLPTWSQWQIERWLSLDDEQRALVTRHLEDIHAWHRRAQLPGWAGQLRQLETELRAVDPGGVPDAAAVARWRGRVTEVWTPMAERIAPGLAELALTLRPEQIERLRRRLAESETEWREKFLPERVRDREQARGDRVVKRAEFFLGRLDRAQERELRALAAGLPATEEAWFAERQLRNRATLAFFETLARERPAAREATRQAREFLLAMWTPREAGRARQLEEAIAASDALTVRMLARATPAQRAHLLKTVQGYAQDFQVLSGTALASAR
jgi:hypothetical protein